MPRPRVREITSDWTSEPIRVERDIFGDPIPDPRVNSHSVLDVNHPNNSNRFRYSEEGRTYTFRMRNSNANPLQFTLGWELEANREPEIVPNGLEQIGDGSVNGDGAEFVVLPAITRSPKYVLGLLKDLVHSPNLNTDESCGFHVHVSASNLTLPRLRHWAYATTHLAIQIEDLAFKAVPESRQDNEYCRRLTPLYNGAHFVSSKYSNDRRYQWLNTVEMFRPNGIRTIENRLLGHTHRWKYVLAWTLFTMELARHGWEVSNNPFSAHEHIAPLAEMLKRIADEIKPLAKRNEPIPQWVHEGLKTFGITPNTWDRPLAKIADTEYKLKGMYKPIYSDNQPEIDDSEDSEYCACGCGNEGRCDWQICEDGDCDNSSCDRCHENDNCGGSIHGCNQCVDNAHENGEDCERRRCESCAHDFAETRAEHNNIASPSANNVTIHPSNTSGTRTGSVPLTEQAMRDTINEISNMTISNSSLQAMAYSSLFYGQSVGQMITVDPALEEMNRQESEFRANQMLDTHEVALSADREHRRARGCPVGCDNRHEESNCLICGEHWFQHNHHTCNNGNTGSFPTIGGR